MDFGSAVIVGIPLVLVVLGLVEWIKQLGVQGNAVRYVSMAIGLIFGIGSTHPALTPFFITQTLP